MNSVDLYRCSELKDGAIRYYRAKVSGRRDDHAEMRVRVEPEALALLEKYRDPEGKRVFRFYKMYASSDGFSSALNGRAGGVKKGKNVKARGLKAVGDAVGVADLEFYYARHSWATIASNDCGIPVDTVDDCLAHVDNRMAKRAYIKKDWTKLYEANRAVLDALLPAER
jgi:integrase